MAYYKSLGPKFEPIGGACGFGGSWLFGILNFYFYSWFFNFENPLRLGFFKSIKVGVIGMIITIIISGTILAFIKKLNMSLYKTLWNLGYGLCWVTMTLAFISPIIPILQLIMLF